ncbi:DNA polymerase III subunit gamma/tau [Pajaroellobacter abortibovis]|uniref:DNA polymerase III subunit gamma/tau n=1 Tax=Pajaroellobacter abortibovis TaxID=1882918 RepID=UPI0009FB0D7E|nr:DNA polymerase III subunit gamma/tau [Pajaroellobacter abortibovis]
MSYLVLARKYRPQCFEDLVGQDTVVRTLTHAIQRGRIAHAFLFTGVRGIGKTTSARLLARCLNCIGENGDIQAAVTRPCQTCPPCQEIAKGTDLDVQEIDGASYNGVEEVRRLQEGVPFQPARDRFKIYIVDEAHMLSTAAWNALLKTLEEPPPHVKFIFATTEAHKIPFTILSRCQRHDFKLIPTRTIASQLHHLLKEEHLQADDAAIAILAQEAVGSMRDALSLLEQVIAFGEGEVFGKLQQEEEGDCENSLHVVRITAEHVAQALGIVERKSLHALTKATLEGDAASVLHILSCLMKRGVDLIHLAKDILQAFRNLVVSKVCNPSERDLLDLPDEEIQAVATLVACADLDDLSRLFHGFSHAFEDIVRSGQPQAALEMALVRLAKRPPLIPLENLIQRLTELEKRLHSNPPSPPSSLSSPSSCSSSYTSPESIPKRIDPLPGLASPFNHPEVKPNSSNDIPPEIASSQSILSLPDDPLLAEDALSGWRSILSCMHKINPFLTAIYEHASPLHITKERIEIAFKKNSLFMSQASEPTAIALLKQSIESHFGCPVPFKLQSIKKEALSPPPSIASLDAEQKRKEETERRHAVEKHPLIQKLQKQFDAKIHTIRFLKKSAEAFEKA